MNNEKEQLAECPNCEGDGFITDSAGVTVPCAVYEGEGEIPKSQADEMR